MAEHNQKIDTEINLKKGNADSVIQDIAEQAGAEASAKAAAVNASILGSPTGGASARSAVGAASNTGKSTSSRPMANPGPQGGRIPQHLPGVSSSANTIQRTSRGTFPQSQNRWNPDPIYPQGMNGPTYMETMYVGDLGPRKFQIPSQSSIAFTQAYGAQSQYNTPQEFAPVYAQNLYNQKIASQAIREEQRSESRAMREQRTSDRLSESANSASEREVYRDYRSTRRRSSAIRVLNSRGANLPDTAGDETIEMARDDLRVQANIDRRNRQIAIQTKKQNALNPSEKTIQGEYWDMKFSGYSVEDLPNPGWGSGGQDYGQLRKKNPFHELRRWDGSMAPSPMEKTVQGVNYGSPLGPHDAMDYGVKMGVASPVTRAQVNAIDAAIQGKLGGQSNVSDAGIRAWMNGAPGPGGGGSGNISPSLQNILNDPNSYNIGSQGQIRAVLKQISSDIPGIGTRFSRGGLVAIGNYAGEVAQNASEYNLTGRRNMGAEANATGSLIGGVIGAGLGALTGTPFGAIIGASVGGTAGGKIADYVVSRDIASVHRQELVMPAAVQSGSLRGDYGGMVEDRVPGGGGFGGPSNPVTTHTWNNPSLATSLAMSDRAFKRANGLGERYWNPSDYAQRHGSGDFTQYYMSPEQMAKSYSTVYGALIEAGINPEREVSSGLDRSVVLGHGGDAAIKAAQKILDDPKSKLWQKNAAVVGAAAGAAENFRQRDIQETKDPLYAMLVERGAIRWGKAGEAIIDKAIAPIISTINQTGNNTADILMKYGVGATNSWIEDTTEIGKKPRVTLPELMNVHSTQERINRSLEFSATKPRGQGDRAVDMIGFEQTNIASIPGGKDSLIYAQLGEEKRQATFRANREHDIMGYDLPMAALEGQEARRQYLPNMPGYGLKLSLERMGMRAPYIAMRQQRYAAAVAGGQLSEEEQLQQFQQIEGLKTEQARDLGMLAEGGQDRMLAFSGGRPSFFSRQNSISLARSAMWHAGSPQVGMGARNGAQLQYQNDFFKQFSTDGFDALHAMAPHSLTGQSNGPTAPTGRDTGILQAILDTLKKIQNSQGGTIPAKSNPAGGVSTNSAYGNARANQQASGLNPSANYGRGQS